MSSLPVIFNKQPILNHQNKLVVFHLSLDAINQAQLNENQWQTAIDTLNEDIESAGGYDILTKGLTTYYSAPLEVLTLDHLPKITPNKLVVEVTSDVIGNKDYLANLKEMLTEGIQIAIKNYTGSEADQKLLKIAHIVKISTQDKTPADIQALTHALPEKTQVVLTQVETEEAFKAFQEAGYQLFEGYYFTDPVIISKEQPLEGSSLAILKLLSALNNPDIEFDEVVELIQTDATLSHKLLAAINHPSTNAPYFIETLKDAVNFMGLKRLKFWVNMMMMSQVDDVPTELLATALIRAKFLESIAEQTGHKADKDRYFMVGLFSTLNAFLKVPMVDIVDKLPLGDEVKQALTDQSGSMGKALFVARALEQGNTQFIMNGHEGMGIMEISSSYMKASGWAHQTLAALAA